MIFVMKIQNKNSFKMTFKSLSLVVISAVLFFSGYFLGRKGFVYEFNRFPLVEIDRQLPADKNDIEFGLFWKVWDMLDSKYYDKDKLIPYKMVYGAIRGMVDAVGDPYTAFFPPEENKIVQEDLRGNFDGVGIQLGYIDKQLAVIAPLPKSPAEEAGVLAGDLILEIKDPGNNIDVSTQGMSVHEAVEIIRGESGTKIILTLFRDGKDEPFETEMLRRTIDVPSIVVDYYSFDGIKDGSDIARIQVIKFSAETKDEWDEAVIDILKKPSVKAIIVDVRNNPGGYLQGAVDLASDFLEVGDVVVIEENGGGDKQSDKVERMGRLKKYKIAVLINKGSASASEIFSGALRDNLGTTLIGSTSFGKGTIQQPEQIDGGSGLHITIARWLTPNEIWVNEKGLEPDIKIDDNVETEEDEQLIEAVKYLTSQIE